MKRLFPIEAPWRFQMGLLPAAPGDLIWPDEDFAADLREKRRLLNGDRNAVFQVLPEAEAPGRELWRRWVELLPRQFPDLYRRRGRGLAIAALGETVDGDEPSLHPLDAAGRSVQEDICLLRRTERGPVLIGASLCFPSRWVLAEKIGRLLADIHGPVPGLNERMGRRIDRFFEHLTAERPVGRINWSVVDDPALFQISGHFRDTVNPNVTAENAGDALWLRMERQTLSLLPETGVVVFGIRILRRPLGEAVDDAEKARTLLDAVRTMDPEMRRYKALPSIGAALEGFLERRIENADRIGLEAADLSARIS
jgi:hypothetical protein